MFFVLWIGFLVFFVFIDSYIYLYIFIEVMVYNQDMLFRYLIKIRCYVLNIVIKDKIVFVRWVEGKFFCVLKDVKFFNVFQFVDIYICFFGIYMYM